MKNLATAITTKFTAAPGGVHNSFYTDIGGRFYRGRAPARTQYPYAVYLLPISDVPEKTFTEDYENVLIQFSLFSDSSSSSEVEDMFTYLKALYDECSLTITGSTLVWMKRGNATLADEEHTTPSGTTKVWAYHIEYEILTSAD